ncbi:MAG: competence/damage-inducible protein A [Planctomycetota bacterium]
MADSSPATTGVSSSAPTVAAVAIGSELLSGKVTDLNVAHAIRELRALGANLTCVLVVQDGPRAIGDAVEYALAHADHVFTCGGVGPTHDDITIAAIAQALDRPLVRDAGLERAIRDWYGSHVNEFVLRMADVPQGARLERDETFFLPLAGVDLAGGKSIHWFPGEPHHFKRQFDRWKQRFAGTRPFTLAQVFLDADEGEVAGDLALVEQRHAVAIGSYPKYDEDAVAAGHRILVTIESKDRAAVEAALQDLIGRLRPGRLLGTRIG